MLRLVGSVKMQTCPKCGGRGRVKCPVTFCTRLVHRDGKPAMAPGDGHPIPCPRCKGAKVVPETGSEV